MEKRKKLNKKYVYAEYYNTNLYVHFNYLIIYSKCFIVGL